MFCAGVLFFKIYEKNLPKTVDNPAKRWYNYTCRQARHEHLGD